MMLRCATIRNRIRNRLFDLPSGEKLPVQRSSWKCQVGYTGVPSQKGGFHNIGSSPKPAASFVNGSDRQMLLILQGEIANLPNPSSSKLALLLALGTLDTAIVDK